MAGKSATLALKITGDSTDGVRALKDTEDHAGRMDGVFGKMGAGIAGGVAIGVTALVGLGKQALDAASELQQSTGAIDAVFGDWALDIEQAAQGASSAVGLSTAQYENMAAVIGAQLHNAGMAHDEMKDKTTALIATGADMAAIFGGTAADAVDALSSALKGEMDPIERYGVSLNQAAIQTQMAADGTDKLTGAAQKQAQTNAILELITKQTADTQGQWAAQSGTAAEAQQILGAKVENLKAKIGEGLLPIFASAATWISDKVLPAVDNLTTGNGTLGLAFDKVGAFVRDVAVPAFDKVVAIVRDYVVPILGTILTPIIDGVRDVFEKVSTKLVDNKDKFQGLYDKVKPFLEFLRDTVAPFIGDVLTVAFDGLSLVLGPIIDAITWILDKAASVVGFIGSVGGAIGDLFGSGGGGGGVHPGPTPLVGAARGAAPLRTAAASSSTGAGTGSAGLTPVVGGDTFHITISGVLDADDAADQIARLLTRRDRFTGAALAAAL